MRPWPRSGPLPITGSRWRQAPARAAGQWTCRGAERPPGVTQSVGRRGPPPARPQERLPEQSHAATRAGRPPAVTQSVGRRGLRPARPAGAPPGTVERGDAGGTPAGGDAVGGPKRSVPARPQEHLPGQSNAAMRAERPPGVTRWHGKRVCLGRAGGGRCRRASMVPPQAARLPGRPRAGANGSTFAGVSVAG